MTRWYASDHHLWHDNIINFCGRPFADVKQMNECLLEYHNATVKSHDHVTFLGDVTLRRGGERERTEFIKEVRKYHGHKRLHLGNHDHWPAKVYLEAGFEKIYATWRDQEGLIYSHFPLHPGSLGTVKANVHGHIHQNSSPAPHNWIDQEGRLRVIPYINICLEVTAYRPISHEEIMVRISEAKHEFEGVQTGLPSSKA